MDPSTHETPRGKNYKKNRRQREAKKRKALKGPLKIDNQPPYYRTLRAGPRKAIKKEAAKKYIHPWIRNNPAFRLQDRDVPTASLLGLPKEVRQKILGLSLEEDIPCPEGGFIGHSLYMDGGRSTRMGQLCGKIGVLCGVSPVLRCDMEFVAKLKKEELLAECEKREKEEMKDRGVARLDQNLPLDRKRKGKVVKAKVSKKRPQRCWKCEVRHFPGGECIFASLSDTKLKYRC
jgi:hypothetical protein